MGGVGGHEKVNPGKIFDPGLTMAPGEVGDGGSCQENVTDAN